MTPQVTPLDPKTASDADLADYHALRVAALAVDMPEELLPSPETSVGYLRTPIHPNSDAAYWAARIDGRLVGVGRSELLSGLNSGLGYANVAVHPAFRRRGVGTALLKQVTARASEAGRATLLASPVKADSAGARWLERLGFRYAARVLILRLEIRGDRTGQAWDAPVAPGYRLVEWSTEAPEELIASYAAARQAIADAPTGTSSYIENEQWTPESIRARERNNAENGIQERVAVAVCEADGTVAAVTVVLRYPYRMDFGHQMDTAVVPAHRGHGLGLAIKGAMLRTLVDAWPELERITTGNAADNKYMLAINQALGFRPLRELLHAEIETTRLTAALAQL